MLLAPATAGLVITPNYLVSRSKPKLWWAWHSSAPAFTLDCDPGWIGHLSRCYKVSRVSSSWRMAWDTCRHQGAHLVSIHSDEENDLIQNLGRQNCWIGARRKKNRRHWRWSDRTPWDYENLRTGGSRHKRCAVIKKYEWVPTSCKASRKYVCSKKGNSSNWCKPV